MSPQIHALAVTALKEEFEAAKSAGLASGVRHWEQRDLDGSPFLVGEYRVSETRRFTVALARPTQMGGRATGVFAAALADRLGPEYLAMCGVCAGNPANTALGDVVVGEPVYEWDEGRQSASGFEGDHRQFRLDPRWARAAQDFDRTGLAGYGEANEDEAVLWLLEQLHHGQEARNHPALGDYFPRGTWQPRLARLIDDGWIRREAAGGVALTPEGAARVRRHLHDDVDGPQRLPLRVLTAPMASGSAVIADPGVWARLRAMGMRKIAAVELEAATIATIAHERRLPWLVAKGVMDYGDARKDDRYKQFAARASADVMFALLSRLLPPAEIPASTDRPACADPPPRPAPPRPPVAVGSPSTSDDTAIEDQGGTASPAKTGTGTAGTPRRNRRRLAFVAATVTLVLPVLVFLPASRVGVSMADGRRGTASPASTNSPSAAVATSAPVPEATPTPTTHRAGTWPGQSPSEEGSPEMSSPSAGVERSTPGTAPSTRGPARSCPDPHVPKADKVLRDGGEAFTVADFHDVSGPTDPATHQPKLRIEGAYLLGENGARLSILRGVPEAERLNCDTGGTPTSERLPLASINKADVIVARTSQYVGKLEITGTGDRVLLARTTSYFVLER